MSVALLSHLFAQEVKVYIMALWPDGVFMATDALEQVLSTDLFDVKEHSDYMNLGFKQGGEVVIRGVASDIRQLYTYDYTKNLSKNISSFFPSSSSTLGMKTRGLEKAKFTTKRLK